MLPEPSGESTLYGPSRVLLAIGISPVFGGITNGLMRLDTFYTHSIRGTRLLGIWGEAVES
jgi:hypothetical protein